MNPASASSVWPGHSPALGGLAKQIDGIQIERAGDDIKLEQLHPPLALLDGADVGLDLANPARQSPLGQACGEPRLN